MRRKAEGLERLVKAPSNLIPYVMRVASGEYEYLKIFGNDYDTEKLEPVFEISMY